FSELKKSTSDIQLQNNNGLESSEIRLIMWNASLQVWKSNFIFGTGTGDYNDELKLYNTKHGNLGVVKEELNSHNQFLNTSVQLGLVGLLILIMIFLSSFLVYPKSIWQTAILIVIFANFLVESFIETQSGIVLFCVLLTFLYSRKEINTVVHNQ
ncbi:MAG: O-antigen ligase family protein, partial [Crocinitomicaceae bacterium]